MSEKKAMIRAGGLWKNLTKDGKTYLSGNLGGLKVLIFQNSYKAEGSDEPDYILHFAEKERKDEKAKHSQSDDLPF